MQRNEPQQPTLPTTRLRRTQGKIATILKHLVCVGVRNPAGYEHGMARHLELHVPKQEALQFIEYGT